MKFHQKKIEISDNVSKKPITNSKDIYEEMKDLSKIDQETLWISGYDCTNIEIYKECIFKGGMSSSTVDPKLIFKRLITNECRSFILVHNHPSGNTAPSEADHLVTKKIQKGALYLDLCFYDHIIIGNGYFSFKDNGFL